LVSAGCSRVEKGVKEAYSGGGRLLVAGLAGHLEGDAIGSGVLELEGGSVKVVEVLVEELRITKVSHVGAIVSKLSAKGPGTGASMSPFDQRIV
jgi:hypothetical protein